MAELHEITIRVPVLRPGDSGRAVHSIKQILNDFARFDGEETLLNEDDWEYRSETTARVKKFQELRDLDPASGTTGPRTWTALLEAWLQEEAG